MTKNIQKQLNVLEQRSAQNLNQFSQMKTALEDVNTEISNTVETIDEEMSRLETQKKAALVRLADNEGAIKGINNLLSGGK